MIVNIDNQAVETEGSTVVQCLFVLATIQFVF